MGGSILRGLVRVSAVSSLAASGSPTLPPRTGRHYGPRHNCQARANLSATSAGGLVFFAGGDIANGGFSNVVDITTRPRARGPLRPVAGAGTFSAASADGMAFFAGGVGDSGYSNVVDIYNTSTNTWSTAALSVGRSALAAASAGNDVVFAGGWNGAPQAMW